MPVLELTTKTSKKVWSSPDGQRTIYEVEMDYQGKTVKAKTYSSDISVAGWTGQAEVYEKEGKGDRPAETFVRQPQKEGGFQHKGNFQAKDEKAIRAMFAIKGALELAKANPDTLSSMVMIEANAIQLFAMVDRVKLRGEGADITDEPVNPDPIIADVPEQLTVDDIADSDDSGEVMSKEELEKMDKIFGPKEEEDKKE